MQVHELISQLGDQDLGEIETRGNLDSVQLTDVVHDSRQARDHTLFCAVPGLTVDGHDYIDSATTGGAAAVLVERFTVESPAVPHIKVNSVRRSMAHAAAIIHGQPSNELAVFGITGTNGKTTTTNLLASIVESTGRQCTIIGTLGGAHTTPESTDLQRELRAAADRVDEDSRAAVVALEVSSHALDQHRADATHFAVAAFSNLTADHLDYHHDMQSYFEAKKRLFDGRAQAEVINIDDEWGQRLAAERPNAKTVSLRDVEITSQTIAGTEFNWRELQASVPLPGQMNLANALIAAESARLLGLEDREIVSGLASAKPVPGRMQIVEAADAAHEHPAVIVDYSHTPDSIKVALATLRAVTPASRLSIVFGCGGDRDRSKRPLMAQAAEAGADRVYLTNDNPRSEDPLDIIAQARAGLEEPQAAVVEPDRKLAIRRAIIDAGPGDVVLIAGKGHEKTQTVGAHVLPFDDVQIARDILKVANP